MSLNQNIPSLNIINRNFSEEALSNILSSLRGKETISRDSINNIMIEPKLQKVFSNSVSDNQEIFAFFVPIFCNDNGDITETYGIEIFEACLEFNCDAPDVHARIDYTFTDD